MTKFEIGSIQRQIATFSRGIQKLGNIVPADDVSAKIMKDMQDKYREKRRVLILKLKG